MPCNLLEMLYAFVFSTEYGVAEDGTRYPVTYTSCFNEMRDTLFAAPRARLCSKRQRDQLDRLLAATSPRWVRSPFIGPDMADFVDSPLGTFRKSPLTAGACSPGVGVPSSSG